MDGKDVSQLILRVGIGDRQAFRLLYDATSAKLFAVCLRVLRDRSEAEEALQEVYIKVWHNASRFAASGYSPITWLAAVARNHAIDRARARKPEAVPIEDAPETAASGPDPEAAVISVSEGERIGKCLGELKAERAAAVQGAYVEGYSYHELAERHGIPVNTMRTWLRRSLLLLRDCLQR